MVEHSSLDARIVLVTRSTRLEELVFRFNTVEQARFYVKHLGADFSDYELEHQTYLRAASDCESVLRSFGRVQRIDRGFLPNFLFAPDCHVVVLGQDGLVANTLKYLKDSQPVLGLNPDPARWDGILVPFLVKDLRVVLPEMLAAKRPLRRVTMARAVLSDGQELHAVNDIFIGPKSHISARYQLSQNGRSEVQSSSGLIISTGLGSTGWLQSLIAGALGMAKMAPRPALQKLRENGLAWDAPELIFTVREPFPSRTTGVEMVFGSVTRAAPLQLVSQMAGYGVIFSDGIEADFLEFNAGMSAEVNVAERVGMLVQ